MNKYLWQGRQIAPPEFFGPPELRIAREKARDLRITLLQKDDQQLFEELIGSYETLKEFGELDLILLDLERYVVGQPLKAKIRHQYAMALQANGNLDEAEKEYRFITVLDHVNPFL